MSVLQPSPPLIPPQAVASIYTRQSGRVARIRILLLGMDLLVLFAAHLLGHAAGGVKGPWHGSVGSLIFSLVALPVLLLLNGAYGLEAVQSAVRMFRSLCYALPEYFGAALLFHCFVPSLGLSPGQVVVSTAAAGLGVVASRTLLYQALRNAGGSHNVLIVGAGWSGQTMAEILADFPGCPLRVVGFVDDDRRKLGSEIVPGCPVLGTTAELARLVIEYQVHELVLAITEQVPDRLFIHLGACAEQGARTVSMSNLYEEITGRVPVKHINDQWFLYCFSPERQRFYEGAKRAVDVTVSLIGLALFGVLLPFLALAILLDSGRPIFYRQVRVGKWEKCFSILKLRTMVQNAETNGAVWAAENDARVTRVGAWLRTSRLDEVPQLLNVLWGEMSLVGPRPERPEFVEDLSQQIPFYNRRHAVLPGITGWAQVKYPYGASVEDALQKLQYDLYYIKHRSLFLDLVIALKTISTMLSRQGR